MNTSHEIEVYVRFCETDAVGHVNNTSYFLYFEEARTKFFSEICPERDASFSFILASVTCDYLSQAYASQILKLSTVVKNVGTKSFTLLHTLKEVDTGVDIAECISVTVCFNYSDQGTIPIPKNVRKRLEEYLIAS